MGLSKIKDKFRAKLNPAYPYNESSSAYTTEPTYSNNGAYSQNSLPTHGRSYPSDLHQYNTADPADQPRRYSPTYQTPNPNPVFPPYMPSPTVNRSTNASGTGATYPVYKSPYTYPTSNTAPAYAQPSQSPYAEPSNNPYQEFEERRGRKSEEDLTEKEKGLEAALHVSDAEKERSAEERRRVVREYLRNSRDTARYKMGS
jgi:hypothetical protein